jgi:hypothetical protein
MSDTDTLPSPAELLATFDKARRNLVELESIIESLQNGAFDGESHFTVEAVAEVGWSLLAALGGLITVELADELEARLEDVIPPCGCGSCW